MLTSQGCVLSCKHLSERFSWLPWNISSREQHPDSLLSCSLSSSTSPHIGIVVCIIYTPRLPCLHTALFSWLTSPMSSAVPVVHVLSSIRAWHTVVFAFTPKPSTFATNTITYVSTHLLYFSVVSTRGQTQIDNHPQIWTRVFAFTFRLFYFCCQYYYIRKHPSLVLFSCLDTWSNADR